MDVEQQITDIITKWEGSYVNIPEDKGGATNHGITQTTLSDWYGRPASIQEVMDLTLAEAVKIYKKNYYYKYHIDLLPTIMQPLIFDMTINHGPKTAGKILQRALNDLASTSPIAVDGIIGDNTRLRLQALMQTYTSQIVIRAIVRERQLFYKSLVTADASQKKFFNGWNRRAESFLIG